MPEVIYGVDQSRSFFEQQVPGHNRWHPDIPPVASVRPGAEFRLECREWFDGTIHHDDSADEVRSVDLSIVHALSGPVAVDGTAPGDLLMVDILDMGPVPQQQGPVAGQGWGYTGIFARENGGGFLTDLFPAGYKAVRDFHGREATSPHLPGVRFSGLPHNALLGSLKGDEAAAAAREAARTVPPRENGGNQDIKNLSIGSRVFMPVFTDGGLLSVGDLHFSQGDGEITFCGAIEMGGYVDLHVDLIKDGMTKYGITANPFFMPGRHEPAYDEYLTFVGLSVDSDGQQHYLDSQLAYRQACLNAITYLTKFGYSREQAYRAPGCRPRALRQVAAPRVTGPGRLGGPVGPCLDRVVVSAQGCRSSSISSRSGIP
jgi:formamidase